MSNNKIFWCGCGLKHFIPITSPHTYAGFICGIDMFRGGCGNCYYFDSNFKLVKVDRPI